MRRGFAIAARSSRLAWPHGLAVAYASTASPGLHQTPAVKDLWERRKVARGDGHEPAPPKPPSASLAKVVYPFSSDLELVDQYRNPWGRARVGRILEDLDALAGTIAFGHCGGNPDLQLVTAMAERIKMIKSNDLSADVELSGKVVWVGNSSMEIQMEARSLVLDAGTELADPWLAASFTFVARDKNTGKGRHINALVPETEAEVELFKKGAAKAACRKKQRKSERGGHAEQITKAAENLIRVSRQAQDLPALADPNTIMLSETAMNNHFICQPQQRNTAGRVFGGFLMRRAFEIAFATA